jgi:hypothetical protein
MNPNLARTMAAAPGPELESTKMSVTSCRTYCRLVRHAVWLLSALLITVALLQAAISHAGEAGGRPLPGSRFGIAVGFPYGYQGAPAHSFMPHIRSLGGGFTKVYLFWNQVEPEKGRYDWTTVDTVLAQLRSPEEALVSVFSSSTWATKKASAVLPPSPAKDPDDYYRFVHALVTRCKGRVRYWQNDAEPANPIYWSGTREEYVAALKVFHKAVKDADPAALVLVGGHDGLFTPPGAPGYPFPNQQHGLDFFEHVIKEAGDAFDVFDLRLYADPYTIVPRVEYMRARLRAAGRDKPIFCTEYGGPNLFEFPVNLQYIPLVVSWSQSVAAGGSGVPAAGAGNPIEELYQKRETLAPQTQMFLQDAPPGLEAKYQRIQARSLVVRNVLALSAGVEKTIYWYLPVARIQGADRFNLMALMYGKIGLLQLEGDSVARRTTSAEAFERMARALDGVESVTRIEVAEPPGIFHFRVDRGGRGPAFVVWQQRDQFSGEDAPPATVILPWTHEKPAAVDALGQNVPVTLDGQRLTLPVSLTPIFLEPTR